MGSKEAIAATLNSKGYHRGLWFDREMAAYCGGKYRMRERVARQYDLATSLVLSQWVDQRHSD